MLYGSWGVTLPGQDRQAAWQRSVGAVRDAGAYAREHGVTLALEVLNRYETSLLNTAAQARRFVEAVALPNVGILLDTYHMNIEERDPAGAIRTAGLMLAHFHCSDNDRSAPGEGHLRWPEIVATLRMIGYRGWLTVECGATAGTAVAETYNIWRDLGSDPDTVARRALQFLRRTLAETSEQV
jgi:D-psicose/D-tagatose/L-ribulose 3-epimerase